MVDEVVIMALVGLDRSVVEVVVVMSRVEEEEAAVEL